MIAIGVIASGCVKKSEFEALQARLDQTAADLAGEKDRAQTLQEALAAAEAEAARLEQEIADTQRALTEATRANSGLQEELARVLKDKAALKESTEKLKEALEELARRKAATDARVAQFRDLLKRFQSLIDAGKLKVKIVSGRMVLVLPTDILFDSGSADLSDVGVAAITDVALILATMPDKEFQVEGHTDNVPINTKRFRNNWELASGRAFGVVAAMLEAGVSPKVLSAASYGENRPAATNDTPEGRAANRRIEIVVVPDLSQLPGFADLEKAVAGG
jgi:chemotaxis protein MotB